MIECYQNTRHKQNFLALGEADVQFFGKNLCLCLMPLSAIFQLYHGNQFYWWKKPEYLQRTTNHGQATGKLCHLQRAMVLLLS